MHLWQQDHSSNAVFSLHPLRWHWISMYSITGDINFDHLIKGVFSDFSTIKLFPIVNNKYFGGRYYEIMQISFLIKLSINLFIYLYHYGLRDSSSSMSFNRLLSLFNVMLKSNQILPKGAPLSWCLFIFIWPHHFFIFWPFLLLQAWNQPFL